MIKIIDEALYRWRKEGWTVESIDNDQYTLVHPAARPVVCGLRTQFQTIGMIQGEMQRALREGRPRAANTDAQFPPPADPKVKRKKKPKARQSDNHFSFDPSHLPKPSPYPTSPYRRRPAEVETPPQRARISEPFENAAWELAMLKFLSKGIGEAAIAQIRSRYETDADYRAILIRAFRETPSDVVDALRERMANG